MSRRASLDTDHGDTASAEAVAAAVSPDNTADVTTTTDGPLVETTIERATTGGLQSTIDDYVVNVRVADRVVRLARATDETPRRDAPCDDQTDDSTTDT